MTKSHGRGRVWLSVISAAMVAESSFANAAELNILTWEGYADPSFIEKFEQSSGCKTTSTYVGSNDDFAPKLAAGGGVYDIIVPSIDTIGLMRQAGFVQPIDTSKIEGWANVYPEFSTATDVAAEGETWSVPLVWGSISLMYRPDKIEPAPDSIGVLFDPKYKGKIAMWDDKSSLYWTARLLGYDNIYDLTDEQLETVKQKLIEQKPLIRKYWATAGELTELYANQEIWVSNTWTGLQSKEVNALDKGFQVVEFTPKEKAEGWMDSMQLVKGTPNEECAYKFFSFMLNADGQCGIVGSTGYFPVNPDAVSACLTGAEAEAKKVNNIEFVKSLVMWQMPARLDKYLETWNAVKAAP
ncbi:MULTISPECIES: ABC transporter substrate-binding protein [Alphaproteobacteria]|uniref:ABC transporter n=2 Tax=Alphaproteobacteria TaxID=28211 RepID=A0A512HGZ4_9HYPH|nr:MULTISPECIES: extracellular solute-binding protein [Alphaproteobacteria]GEO84718.1 ABC transporter [Ciceribacter naphthalenivorans]GLR20661.1 ABC transporter [Ciceribacter naphthalenivorans]GLT03517.1 ABC transporter [Sphingomonas psychrolutea]